VAAYSINEHALILTDDRIWQRCVVKNRLPGTGSYEVAILQEPGSELRVQANEKAMSKLQIWVCASCGNWIDPDKLHDPAPVEPDGTRPERGRGRKKAKGKQILLRVTPRCDHGPETPFLGSMILLPWTEVEGVAAIGGLHAV
jgi:hypothetical protein